MRVGSELLPFNLRPSTFNFIGQQPGLPWCGIGILPTTVRISRRTCSSSWKSFAVDRTVVRHHSREGNCPYGDELGTVSLV